MELKLMPDDDVHRLVALREKRFAWKRVRAFGLAIAFSWAAVAAQPKGGGVYLADEPTNAFGRLGCREDAVAGLREMGVNFLRWGGTMCNAEDYLLKNFGPDRKPYRGFWHRHSSGGFGPREFARLAAEMKLPCAVSISVREEIAEAVRFAEDLKAYDIPIIVQIGNEECMSREPAVCREKIVLKPWSYTVITLTGDQK